MKRGRQSTEIVRLDFIPELPQELQTIILNLVAHDSGYRMTSIVATSERWSLMIEAWKTCMDHIQCSPGDFTRHYRDRNGKILSYMDQFPRLTRMIIQGDHTAPRKSPLHIRRPLLRSLSLNNVRENVFVDPSRTTCLSELMLHNTRWPFRDPAPLVMPRNLDPVQLTSLHIFTQEYDSIPLSQFTSLTSLTILSDTVPQLTIPASLGATLKNLNLCVTNFKAIEKPTLFTALETLCIRNRNQYHGDLTDFRNLRSLTLNGHTNGDIGPICIDGLTKLEYLDLSYCRSVKSLPVSGTFTKLHTLLLEANDFIDTAMIAKCGCARSLGRLDLDSNTKIKNIECLRYLHSLSLKYGCGIEHIPEHIAQRLRTLNLIGNRLITDISSATQLQTLYINREHLSFLILPDPKPVNILYSMLPLF